MTDSDRVTAVPPAVPDREAGVDGLVALQDSVEGARLCRLDYHAWTPWLGQPEAENPGWYITYCARKCGFYVRSDDI